MIAFSEDLKSSKVKLEHFLRSKEKVSGRLTKQMISEYEGYAKNLKLI